MNYFPQECKEATNIIWSDALHKLDVDASSKRFTTILPASEIKGQDDKIAITTSLPTIIAEGRYCPPSFRRVLKHMIEAHSMGVFHTYISFSKNSITLGRHNDTLDVMIVQAIGEVTYHFDDVESVKLTPGDALYIPKGEFHAPEIHGPRVTLSFSKL